MAGDRVGRLRASHERCAGRAASAAPRDHRRADRCVPGPIHRWGTSTSASAGIGGVFGDRLHLIERGIDHALTIERVDLLIANLIVEYVGAEEFVAFAGVNADSIGVLSCVIQRNDAAGFVSSTQYASSFDALASVSSVIDPEALVSMMSRAGLIALLRREYPLPNGKTLVRQDFRPISHELRS